MGIIFYEILFGVHPWNPQTQADLINLPKTRPLRFKSEPNISKVSRDFIEGCLKYQESDRFSWD
jgi:serine/threonine protein kinase